MEEAVGHLHDGPFAARLRARATRARPTSTMAFCAPCPLRTLCGGGCRSENLQLTGDPEQPLCGPWRVEVLAELLSEDRTSALEWQATHLAAEARSRGIAAPERFEPARPSRHLIDT
jgi:sulfatase maturation enzyme AslB (radical SAM superfamily)